MAMVLVGITAEAQLVRSATLTVTREDLPPVELGWKHIINAQVGAWDFAGVGGGIHYIAGYRFTQNLLAGVGVGYDYSERKFVDDAWGTYENLYSVPFAPHGAVALYLHGRYFFSTDVWAPYVGASAGGYLSKKSEIYKEIYAVDEWGNNNWQWIDSQFVTKVPASSLFIDLNVGLNHRMSTNYNIEWSIYAGLKLWSMPYYYNDNTRVDNIVAETEGTGCLYIGTSFAF